MRIFFWIFHLKIKCSSGYFMDKRYKYFISRMSFIKRVLVQTGFCLMIMFFVGSIFPFLVSFPFSFIAGQIIYYKYYYVYLKKKERNGKK